MKALVALSGGMDSATLLAHAIHRLHYSVEAVGFTYGSKHNKYENVAAVKVAHHYGVNFTLFDLEHVFKNFKSNLLKSGGDIPEGHYEAESMKQTVVPGRNLIFLSIMAGLAESKECSKILVGVHAGDHHIYPDCRPNFLLYAGYTIEESTEGKVHVQAPFTLFDKAAIVHEGIALQVPYHKTRTCYKDQPVACGKCGSCQERLWAFSQNNELDPIPYEANVLLPKA